MCVILFLGSHPQICFYDFISVSYHMNYDSFKLVLKSISKSFNSFFIFFRIALDILDCLHFNLNFTVSLLISI